MSITTRLQSMAATTLLGCTLTSLPLAAARAAEGDGFFNRPQHFEALTLKAIGADGWHAGLSKAAQTAAIFYQDQPMAVELTLIATDKDFSGEVTLEIDQIGLDVMPGGCGQGNLFAYIRPLGVTATMKLGKLAVKAGASQEIPLELAIPAKLNGVFALILDGGPAGRQVVGTVMRTFAPTGGDGRNSPVLMCVQDRGQVPAFARMGVRWLRTDSFPGWRHAQPKIDGPFDWTEMDQIMKFYEDQHFYILSNSYGAPEGTVDAANHAAYNLIWAAKFDEGFGTFVYEVVKRYNRDGTGPLQIIDYQNEPWEGGGISGWKSDAPRYRQLYKILYENAKRAVPDDPQTGKPRILIGAASSIMNTIDKFFGDGSTEWDRYFDVITDHYVLPSASFGPSWGNGRAKPLPSLESETWLGHSENAEAIVIAQFMAVGQWKVTPNHNTYLNWNHPYSAVRWQPTPVAAGLASALHFIGERPMNKVVFTEHLPWLYQWGSDHDAVFMLVGESKNTETDTDALYKQIVVNGGMTIDSAGGKLNAYDIFGNPIEAQNGKLDLPLRSQVATWLNMPGAKAQDVIKLVAAGQMTGVTPVEIVLNDFTAAIKPGMALPLSLHNVLTTPVTGTVTIRALDGITLDKPTLTVTLKPGERRALPVTVAKIEVNEANAYRVEVTFDGKDGKAKWAEPLHVATARRGTPAIDGNLDDWSAAIPIVATGKRQAVDMTDQTWRPWIKMKETDPNGAIAEVRTLWDDQNFYLAARLNTTVFEPKVARTTLNDDVFFGTGSMAQTYVTDPWSGKHGLFYGDVLQIGFGLGLGDPTLKPVCQVPKGFLAEPDTDYEYALYATEAKEGNGAEIWRAKVPGMPYLHDLPRCTKPTDEALKPMMPKGSKIVVKREGQVTTYEAAIPWSELKKMKPKVGKEFCFTFSFTGAGIRWGQDRSATKDNGLTLHPLFVKTPSNAMRWGLSE